MPHDIPDHPRSPDWQPELPASAIAELEQEMLAASADQQQTPFEIRPIRVFRLDLDLVARFGLNGAIFAKYLECMIHGKYVRQPDLRQYTYDPASVIAERTGLSTATLARLIRRMRRDRFLLVRRGRRQGVSCFGFRDQVMHYKARDRIRRVYCLKTDVDVYGIPAAMLLNNLRYWHSQNKERWRLHAGHYWRYTGFAMLAEVYRGFLSYDQVRDAINRLRRAEKILTLDYYDRKGVRHKDKFWVTLVDIPAVDDFEPENFVRWKGLKPSARSGTTSILEFDKTILDFDKTTWDNDKTTQPEKQYHPAGNKPLTNAATDPLIVKPLTTSSAVAGAPSCDVVETCVKQNLSLSGCRGTPDEASSLSLLKGKKAGINYPVHMQEQSSPVTDPASKKVQADDDGLPELKAVFNTLPRSAHQNFWHFFRCDLKQAKKKLQEAKAKDSSSFPVDLQYALEAVNQGKMPKNCFSKRYSHPANHCEVCEWKSSCRIATPPAAIKVVQATDAVQQDNPNNVRETYRQAYRDVLGRLPPDAIGEAGKLLEFARNLNIPVRWYCLVHMTHWVDDHPKQTYFAKFLLSKAAYTFVDMLVDVCRNEYATVTEDRLAMLLDVPFKDHEPVWRHQPTLLEDFVDQWCKAFQKKFGQAYVLIRQDTAALNDLAIQQKKAKIAGIIRKTTAVFKRSQPPTSMCDFLFEVTGESKPELEVDWLPKRPARREKFGDNELVDVADWAVYRRRQEAAKKGAQTRMAKKKECGTPFGAELPSTGRMPIAVETEKRL